MGELCPRHHHRLLSFAGRAGRLQTREWPVWHVLVRHRLEPWPFNLQGICFPPLFLVSYTQLLCDREVIENP
jgi:hypothetical protein